MSSLFLCALVIVLASQGCQAAKGSFLYMYNMCGQTKNVGMKDSGIIKWRIGDGYQSNYDCIMTLASADPRLRINLRIDKIDLRGSSLACMDTLTAYDGRGATGRSLFTGCDDDYLGRNMVYSSSGNAVSLRLSSTLGFGNVGDGFRIAYNTFYDASVSGGRCQPGEFRCTNNRCIDQALKCDIDDDCGDRSDESENKAEAGCDFTKVFKGIMKIGMTALIIIIVVVVLVCLCCCGAIYLVCKRRNDSGQTVTIPMQPAEPPPQPSPQPSPYPAKPEQPDQPYPPQQPGGTPLSSLATPHSSLATPLSNLDTPLNSLATRLNSLATPLSLVTPLSNLATPLRVSLLLHHITPPTPQPPYLLKTQHTPLNSKAWKLLLN
ncbi:uncharacterized protein LOC144925831 [Branchiostoma floridae x Branchiostoma belcheri]